MESTYDLCRRKPDCRFSSMFLEIWNRIMQECLEGKTAVSREWFMALHKIAEAEAAYQAMERCR